MDTHLTDSSSVFIPSGAILLRLGLKNPIVLKLHAFLQILSYTLYIVAAGMGKQTDPRKDLAKDD